MTVGDAATIVDANLRASVMLGVARGALVGQPLTRFVLPEDQDTYYRHRREVAVDGQQRVGELRMVKADGAPFWARLESVASQEAALGRLIRTTISDITELRRLHAEVAQSDRMASVGLLAAGVAHELNNPLTYTLPAVIELAEFLPELAAAVESGRVALANTGGGRGRDDVTSAAAEVIDPDRLADLVVGARDAAVGLRKIHKIVRGFSYFSRIETPGVVPIDLNEAATHAIQMTAHELRPRATLVTDFGRVPRVLATEGKLAQVFLNLLANAAQAIPPGDPTNNHVRVRTWTDDLGCVCAEVRDSGCGIAPEDLERIFEPFFTGEPRRGTGLGLAIARRIVTQLGGEIRVESRAGQGSRFELRFPTQGAEPARQVEVVAVPPPIRGRVLIVDDEDMVRAALVRILRDSHDVVEVGSGRAAMELLGAGGEFDVVLCDVMMPDVSGVALHRWLADSNPQLVSNLMFLSGGVVVPETRAYLTRHGCVCLDKPVSVAELRSLVAARVAAAPR